MEFFLRVDKQSSVDLLIAAIRHKTHLFAGTVFLFIKDDQKRSDFFPLLNKLPIADNITSQCLHRHMNASLIQIHLRIDRTVFVIVVTDRSEKVQRLPGYPFPEIGIILFVTKLKHRHQYFTDDRRLIPASCIHETSCRNGLTGFIPEVSDKRRQQVSVPLLEFRISGFFVISRTEHGHQIIR